MDFIRFISVSADIKRMMSYRAEWWYGAISAVNMGQEQVTLGLWMRDSTSSVKA